jgi:formylmethanofuran dehydrogenase subunit E
MQRSFEQDLERAIAYHGHLCAGQVIGTRIARAALEYFGIEDADTYRDLIAFVEADRCIADAVSTVANCKIGRRRLRWYDYGKMAASFYNIADGRAIRIVSINNERAEPDEDVVAFFNRFSDQELLKIQEVAIDLDEHDLPGKPKRSVRCDSCGEKVMDNRDVQVEGRTLCKVCAGEPTYYRVIGKIEPA